MAELRNLEVKITANTSGLADISKEAGKASKEVEKLGKQGNSTFAEFDRTIKSSALSIAGYAAAFTAAIVAVRQFVGFISQSITDSANQQKAYAALANSLKNVGVAYVNVAGEVQSTFDAIQKTTTFSGNEQARVLQNLVQLTGDYETSLKSLKTTLDFSAGAGISLETAAKAIGSALEGNVGVLSRYEPSLKGVRREQFNLLSDSKKLEVVLGALNKRYAGSADALANTYAGAVVQVKNAQEDFRAAVGDFITSAPQFIALLQEIAASYLDITEKIQDYRTNQETGNRLADEVVDKVEALAKGFFIAGNVVKVFGNIFGIVFNAILTIIDFEIAKVGFLIGLLLKGALAFQKFRKAQLESSQRGFGAAFGPKVAEDARREIDGLSASIESLQTDINNIGQFTNMSLQGVGDSFRALIGNAQDLGQNLKDIGDTSQIEAFFDRVRQRTEELKGKLNDTTTAANNNNNALDQLTNGTNKLSKEQKQLIRDKEQFLKSLLSEGEGLAKEIALFGATDEEIANYEQNMLLATARSLGFGDSLDEVIEKLTQMKKELAQLELKEKLADELQGVLDVVKTESQKIGEELATQINTILQNVVLNPDLINFEKAQEIINQLTQQALQAQAKAQADLIQQEKEAYIERLKNSDSFFDQLKGGFLDFANQVESNGELISQFFADTLSQMSQNFSDLFYNALTGKFDDLVDAAKAAFKAILRAFLDLVSAIATRQIVISIAGLFGVDTKGAKGTDLLSSGAGIGKDLLGAGGVLGGIFGGGAAGSTAIAGTLGGIPITEGAAAGAGLLGSAGAGAGVLATVTSAVTIIGAVIGAAALAFTLLAPLFQKTPRLDIDFDSVKTEVGRRAAEVAEFLDPEFFKEQIAQISVKRHAGLGVGGDDAIKDIIQKKIAETVDAVQDIINKLPEELAKQLNEALLNTPVDIETVVKGERLLEFDAKGKKIKEKFEAFINGELSAKFLFAIRDFFVGAFESLGVLPDKAQAFIDAEFEKFKNAGSREERAAIGQELLASFNAFVDAFNIVSGNVNDAIGQTIANVNALAQDLGFEAVPSIGELREELGKLLENAELDPETVQKYVDLRNAIVQGIQDIAASISGLISKIQSLNDTIIGFGGEGVDLGGFIDQAQTDLINFFKENVGNLSLAEQEAFLDQIGAFAQAQLAEERAAFEAEQRAQQAAAEAAKAAVQARIDGLNAEKDKINEAFRARIDSLNEELRIAEDFAQLTESIRKTLDSILFSPESVLTGVEQVNALQSRIANLQADISRATDPEDKLKIAQQIQEAFSNLFDAAGEAFGVNSPEFVAIFDQVTGGLENLADLTSSQGRSVEEINAEIEKLTAENQEILKGIDAQIEAANAQISAISQQTANNTFKASQQLQETFEWLRNEYLRILEERLNQLDEATTGGFANELEAVTDVAKSAAEMKDSLAGIHGDTGDSVGLLTQIRDSVVGGGGGAAGGSGVGGADGNPFTQMARGGVISEPIWGIGGRTGRGYLLGEAGREYVIPESKLRNTAGQGISEMNVKIDVNVNGGSQSAMDALPGKIEDMLVKSIRQGKVRKAVQSVANSGL